MGSINQHRTQRLAIIIAAAFLMTTAGTTFAEDSRWNLRCRGVIVSGDEAFSVDNSAGGSTIAGGNSAIGVGVAAERRLSDRFGVELAAMFAKVPDTDVTDTFGESLEVDEGPSIVPVSLSLNIHLTPKRKVDLYIAPTVAFVTYGDFDLEVDDEDLEFETDNDLAWGASAGADIRLTERWSFNLAFSYLDTDMEVTATGSGDSPTIVGFDPLIASAGVTLRF